MNRKCGAGLESSSGICGADYSPGKRGGFLSDN
jgi:hypothetical protein